MLERTVQSLMVSLSFASSQQAALLVCSDHTSHSLSDVFTQEEKHMTVCRSSFTGRVESRDISIKQIN